MHAEPVARDLIPQNSTSHNNTYTHGLAGVDQIGNYVFINAIVGFFCLLLLLSLALRLSKMGNNHLRHVFAAGPGRDKQSYWTHNSTSWWPWTKRHVLYAPLGSKRHNKEMQLSSAVTIGTLPSRYHSILLAVYVLTNLAYCAVLDYSNENKAATLAELRGRSGALAVLNMVPTVIFALRNNPLIPLLRVSYDTFNLLHRWTARIVVLETIVHVLAWGANHVVADGWDTIGEALARTPFMTWGTVAVAAFVLISMSSWSPIRHAFYETFVNLHRLVAIVGIAGVYVHLHAGNLPQLPYLQLVVVFYALDWFLRVARIIYYNHSRKTTTKVTVEALPSEACRITFELARPWKFRPGSHVHTYIPAIGWWSSHPFSVAWADEHKLGALSEKLPTSELDLDREEVVKTTLSLVVRARTGMTRKLFDKASQSHNGVMNLHGAIEGPYGGHESLDSYGTVLLFAGGIGITHQIGYIRHLVAGSDAGMVAARKITLVWSVPNTEALEWVRPWMDEILRMKGRREVLRIMLFVTKPKSQQEVHSGTGTVQMFPGRCNPQTVLDKEFVERTGAMVVTVCGPGAFADSVRHAVRKRVEMGSVDFIEEAFTY